MRIFEIIKYPLILLIFGLVLGCGSIKEIPVQTVEKVVVKDSVVYVRDSVWVEVPKEKIVRVLPADTTSQIATSLAFSEAKIEKGILTHSLEQKGQIRAKIDTVITVQYVDRFINKEVPVEVVKEVKHIPNFFWFSLILNVVGILILTFKIYLKSKLKL